MSLVLRPSSATPGAAAGATFFGTSTEAESAPTSPQGQHGSTGPEEIKDWDFFQQEWSKALVAYTETVKSVEGRNALRAVDKDAYAVLHVYGELVGVLNMDERYQKLIKYIFRYRQTDPLSFACFDFAKEHGQATLFITKTLEKFTQSLLEELKLPDQGKITRMLDHSRRLLKGEESNPNDDIIKRLRDKLKTNITKLKQSADMEYRHQLQVGTRPAHLRPIVLDHNRRA